LVSVRVLGAVKLVPPAPKTRVPIVVTGTYPTAAGRTEVFRAHWVPALFAGLNSKIRLVIAVLIVKPPKM